MNGSAGPGPASVPSLSQDDWDALVEGWNVGTTEAERAQRARECRQRGHHRWALVPIGWRVCTDCVTYRAKDDE